MSNKYDLKNWDELELGGVNPEGGKSKDYETGTWRPQWKEEHCVHCLTCWALCPEDAYVLKDGQTASGKERKEIDGINYYHCKGCGLCVKECPVNKKGNKKAIDFVREDT
jgi:pyruvate ferredoxin oxidoreductase delta subunit